MSPDFFSNNLPKERLARVRPGLLLRGLPRFLDERPRCGSGYWEQPLEAVLGIELESVMPTRIGGGEVSGFLADELYRSTCKSFTPTL